MRYVVVDLDDFYNARAISRETHMEDGDVNGVGSSYPQEDLPKGNIVINGVPYRFPSYETANGDNVEFEGQRLNVPKGRYIRMHVLGAANQGSFREEVHVCGKSRTRVYISLTDWLEIEPTFGEQKAFVCNKIHRKEGMALDNLHPIVWSQVIELTSVEHEIDSIEFPDNPSMHIFSLTLEKEGDEDA